MKVRKLLAALALVALTLTLGTAAAQAKYTFYVIGVQPNVSPFWATVYKGVQAAEEVLPIDVQYLGMSADQINATGTVNLLETALAAQPDGIVTGFWFLNAERDVVMQAIDSGVAVVAYNQGDDSAADERIPYLGYVGQDERVTGRMLAEAMLAKTDIKRAAIGVQYPGSVPIELRAQGIQDVLEEAGIPSEKLNVGTDPSSSITTMNAYLQGNPDTNVIFALGPEVTLPAMQLLEEQNLKGKVSIATFDVSQPTLDGLISGDILATISQQPFAQGFLSVMYLYMYKEFGILPPEGTPTGPQVVDENNLDIIRQQFDSTGGA